MHLLMFKSTFYINVKALIIDARLTYVFYFNLATMLRTTILLQRFPVNYKDYRMRTTGHVSKTVFKSCATKPKYI